MSVYDLVIAVDDDSLVVSDIVETFGNEDHAAFTRVISLSLRSGAPVKFVVEQLKINTNQRVYFDITQDEHDKKHNSIKCIIKKEK
jgi:DNA primase